MKTEIKFIVMFHKTLFFILSATNALACSVPTTGDEYDSLVELKQISGFGKKYEVSAPIHIDNAKFDSAMVHTLNMNDEVLLEMPMEMKQENEKVVGTLNLYDEDSIKVHVSVWWAPKDVMCPIIGNVELKHNQSLHSDEP